MYATYLKSEDLIHIYLSYNDYTLCYVLSVSLIIFGSSTGSTIQQGYLSCRDADPVSLGPIFSNT